MSRRPLRADAKDDVKEAIGIDNRLWGIQLQCFESSHGNQVYSILSF